MRLISFRPAIDVVRRALGNESRDLEHAAVERWEIAPAETRFIGPAVFLPGQLDRIRGAEFGSVETVVRDFQGGFESIQGETLGFRLKGVDLVDGVLYASGALQHLRPRAHRSLTYSVPNEAMRGTLYESWVGNRWFGNWLFDDCLTYRLAEPFGAPVTTNMTADGHVPRYEELLGLSPRRVDQAHFDELIVFRDSSHNANRKARADDLRRRLIAAAPVTEHPGVFLLRGGSGKRRVLTNEHAIAERLAIDRGFRVIDPGNSTVDEIVAACAGARIVMGVEGSHIVHGLAVMPPNATLFVIQPPDRVVSVLKIITDRQGQGFAFVVATGGEQEFSVTWDEIERTLDLIAAEN